MASPRELKRTYKETALPMGVYVVRNRATRAYVLGSGLNLQAALNRFRFILSRPPAPNSPVAYPRLRADFEALGPDGIEFAVLDTLRPKDTPGWDPAEDLRALEALWDEQLRAAGGTPYPRD